MLFLEGFLLKEKNENLSTVSEKKCIKNSSGSVVKNLSREEVKRLFRVIKNHGSLRDLAIFQVSYYCGLRVSEVGMLTHADWDDKAGVLRIRRLKGSLLTRCFLDSHRAIVLRRYLKSVVFDSPTDPLFPSRHGFGISRYTLHKLMKKYCALARIPLSLRHYHVLKHSIAVHMLDSLAGLEDVQYHLGHADIKNTKIYAKYSSARSQRFNQLIRKSNYIAR